MMCENAAAAGVSNFGNYRMVAMVVKRVVETIISELKPTGPGAKCLLIGREGCLSLFVLRFRLTPD